MAGICMESEMAFLDDARHTGVPLFATRRTGLPRQFYTWATLATSLAIWAVMIIVVMGQL